MIGSIKSTVKDTLIYGFGNIAVKIVGLILIPIYTDDKYFSVNDFGIIGILDISGIVLISILTFSVPQAFSRWFWDKDHKENQKGIFFLTLISQIIVSSLLCILLLPLSGTFSKVLFNSADWSHVITLLILSSAFQVINNLINTLMRLQSKSSLYTLTNIFKLLTVLAFTLYFILFKKMGIEGIYLAQVIGNVLFIFLLSFYTIKNCSIYFEKRIIKEMNIYGFPLFLGGVSAVFLNVIDRFSLNSLSVLKSVALYTLAIKISNVIKLVLVDSIKLSILPTFLKKMDSPDNRRYYSKILLYSSYVIMFTIVGLSLFSFEITKIISKSKEYWGAVAIIPILALSVFFINMKEVMVYGLHIAKKSRIVGSIVVVSTVFSLGLNIILIPLYDITGAAVATLLSQAFYWFVCYYFSQKVFFIPYEIKKLMTLFILGTILSFSGIFLNDFTLFFRMLLKSLLIISFPFILYIFRFYEPVELLAIRGFALKWSNLKMLKANLNSLKYIKDDD